MAQQISDLIVHSGDPVEQLLLPPVAVTTTGAGPSGAADMLNGTISLNALIFAGAVSGTSPSLAVQITECATTNGTFTLIPGCVATVTTSNQFFQVRGLRTQRYVQYNVATVSGTTPSAVIGVIALEQGRMAQAGGFDNYPSGKTYP